MKIGYIRRNIGYQKAFNRNYANNGSPQLHETVINLKKDIKVLDGREYEMKIEEKQLNEYDK